MGRGLSCDVEQRRKGTAEEMEKVDGLDQSRFIDISKPIERFRLHNFVRNNRVCCILTK